MTSNKEIDNAFNRFYVDLLGTGFTPPLTKQYRANLYSKHVSAVAVHSNKFSAKQNSFCILNFLQYSTVQHQG